MSMVPPDFIEKVKNRIRSGIIFSAGAYANSWVSERIARRYLQENAEAVVGVGGALVIDYMGSQLGLGNIEPVLNDIADAASDYGIWEGITKVRVLKEPKCFFRDGNTIKCINFDVDAIDAANLQVYIDDVKATVASVTGGPSSFEISLSTPASAGWRKLVVIAGNAKKDSFRGKVYVP